MTRRTALTAALAAALLALTSASPALADYGSYTADSGESCTWSSFGSAVSLDCSGYNRRVGGYVNYHCDIDYYGGGMSYRCRSIDGATWSGSR